MNFTGTLNSIPLIDVVQLVALAQKTGTLTVVTNRGRFTLTFRAGRIVEASASRFAPIAEATGGDSLRSSGGHELKRIASKIVNLRGGCFSFQPCEPRAGGEGVEVSSLLLDSCRQYDEAVRDGLAPAEVEPEPVPALEVLGQDAALEGLYELFRLLPADPSPGDLSWLILQAASRVFRRAVLFLVTEKDLEGVGGFGPTQAAEAGRLVAALSLIRIPRGAPSVLEDVADACLLGTGPADAAWWARYIPKEFGAAPLDGYVAAPVVAAGACRLVLYGDTFAHMPYEGGLRALEIFNRHAGLVLENIFLRQGGGAREPRAPFALELAAGGRRLAAS